MARMERKIIKGSDRKRKFPTSYMVFIVEDENEEERNVEISTEEVLYVDTEATEEDIAFGIIIVKTNQPSLKVSPGEKQIFVVKKPNKTDIFLSDKKLLRRIANDLNQKLKGSWAPNSWHTDQDLTIISALKRISKKKINKHVIPLIKEVIKNYTGDERL